ncbi:MAG: type II toxin-antitoxin system VapC family toxin [Candidatus Rokubacteria bacterium]|nr:type II toxin-antitoxin system VapC family toxin [Candidatus Rokubacteria bacterium]
MRLVVDCSVTMGWCFESEADRYTDAALHALDDGEAVVPALWALEVSNVLLVAERRRRIERPDSARFLRLLTALPIVIADSPAMHDIDALLTLGRRHGLSAYDAAYLQIAVEQRLPLATRDRALRAAAVAAGVPAFAR